MPDDDHIAPPPPSSDVVVEYDDPSAHKVKELTPAERVLCQNVVVFGLDYMRTVKGWTLENIRDFLARVEVSNHIHYLQQQYLDRGGIQERTQFFAQLQINGYVPAALNILARALVGTKVDPDTGKVLTRGPDRGQFDAAVEILSRANIQGSKFAGNDTLPRIDARQVNVTVNGAARDLTGLTPKQRKAVTKLLGKVVERIQATDRAEDIIAERQLRPAPVDDDEEVAARPVDAEVRPASARPSRASPSDEDPRDRG